MANKKQRLIMAIFTFAIIVSFAVIFKRMFIDGYHDYPTTVIHSEQPNDSYLEALLKWNGYQGKKVSEPRYGSKESERLTKTLEKNGYKVAPMTPMIERNESNTDTTNQDSNTVVLGVVMAGIVLLSALYIFTS